MRNGTRKRLLITLGVVVAALAALWWTAAPRREFSCGECNVILISVDTLGAAHLGLYGYPLPTSPFLDELAGAKGIVFENAVAQAPWTLPSHTAMLTGRYPAELGIWIATDALPQEATTVAEALKERGFATRAFSNGAFVQPEWGFDQGFDGFSGSLAIPEWDDAPTIFTEAAAWLAEGREKPFFLFIRSFHVHDPYTPSREAREAVGGAAGEDVRIERIVGANTKAGGPNKEDASEFRAAYDAEVRELDDALGAFFGALDKLELLGNTLVIFTADHGEEFGEHGIAGFHAALYGETIRVPLVVFLPQGNAARLKEAVEVRSIPSTILELLELAPNPAFPAPSLFSPPREGHAKVALSASGIEAATLFRSIEAAYATIEEFGKTLFAKPRKEEWSGPSAASARSARWHLIRNADNTFELYDLTADAAETRNLFPEWTSLPAESRREALEVVRALAADVPIPCGAYCPSEDVSGE